MLATQFYQTTVYTAREVGLLPILTELVITAAMFAFLGAFVFFLARGNSVHPAHRAAGGLMAVVCLIGAVAYWYVRYYYHDMMHELAVRNGDPVAHINIIRDGFFAIGLYRYMQWVVTAPVLLFKTVLLLKVKPREIVGWIALLIGGAVWMIIMACIGDQQISPDGALIAGRHLEWGALAAVGYVVVPSLLLARLGPRYGGWNDDESGHAFRVLAYSTATTWLVYPLGYVLTTFLPRMDLNWIHLLYTLADLANGLGVGIVSYLAGAEALARRSPPEAVQTARIST